MNELQLDLYWDEIPIGKENAVSYLDLMTMWNTYERKVRWILHALSSYDNGDDYVLIRSSKYNGFFRTDDEKIIEAFKKECLNKGKSIFAPVKKINRIMSNQEVNQITFENNLRYFREMCGLIQGEVCKVMKEYDSSFDNTILSKMENSICLPTPFQLQKLAKLYGCKPSQLIDLYQV